MTKRLIPIAVVLALLCGWLSRTTQAQDLTTRLSYFLNDL